MKDLKILKRIAKIFDNQQKILVKLADEAYPGGITYTDPNEELDPDDRKNVSTDAELEYYHPMELKGKKLLEEAMKSKPDPSQIKPRLNQLIILYKKDPSTAAQYLFELKAMSNKDLLQWGKHGEDWKKWPPDEIGKFIDTFRALFIDKLLEMKDVPIDANIN